MDSSLNSSTQSSENLDPNVAAATQQGASPTKDTTAAQNPQQAKAWNPNDATSTVSSIEDLRSKSPELFKQMMMGIAQQICKEMKESQERLKKNLRGQ